jgi:kynurenine formamidase
MFFPYNVIDLTYSLSAKTPSWYGSCGFHHKKRQSLEESKGAVQFFVHDIEMQEGIGTHMDAPAHCFEKEQTIDQIPIDHLVAPVFVIDISDRATESYQLSAKDILDFELQYGEIKACSFVIIRTGWSRFWGDSMKYRNNLNFPSISEEAISLLLQRDIRGIGIDTLSPDAGDIDFPVHRLVLGAGKYIVENIANADALPPIGAYILIAPMKIEGGTEAPIRLIALVDKEDISLKRMEMILDLKEDINPEEMKLSRDMFGLLKGKKIIATRILFNKKRELLIELEDGRRLFVDNFKDQYDISMS